MPQGRIVLKSICQSKKMAELKTDGARLLYTWLLPNVDINGCFLGDAEVIKGQIFTRLKKTSSQINSWLSDLDSVGLIVWYQTNGDKFLWIPDFQDKQPSLNPAKEAESSIQLPTPEQLKSRSGATLLKVKESKVKQSEAKDDFPENLLNSPEFLEVWSNWQQHRTEIRKKLTPSTRRSQLKKLAKLSVPDAIAMINHSIECGYTGLYAPKPQAGQRPSGLREGL